MAAAGTLIVIGAAASCWLVLEVGTHSPWISRLVASFGHEVLVANPSAMYGARRRRKRNDRLDAEFLARQGRADVRLLHPIQHRSALAQQHLEVLRARDQLVRTRTAWINHVRGAVKALGTRLPEGLAIAGQVQGLASALRHGGDTAGGPGIEQRAARLGDCLIQ